MSQMRIDEVLPSKSGKAWRVKSGGKWYGAFGDSGIEAHVGKLIDAEITTSEKYGLGIAKYKVIDAPSASMQAPGPIPAAKPERDLYWLAFTSNQVAHAIAAGLITKPDELKSWTFAAMNAIKGAVEGDIGI